MEDWEIKHQERLELKKKSWDLIGEEDQQAIKELHKAAERIIASVSDMCPPTIDQIFELDRASGVLNYKVIWNKNDEESFNGE